MPYGRVQLFDPAPGGIGAYAWKVNYSEENEFGESRAYTTGQSADGTALLVQQAGEEPMTISLTGTILERAQHRKFVEFFHRGRLQTLIFTDFEGFQYEVLMKAYKPLRKRTLSNPRDTSIRLHYYTYTMELLVVRVATGDWT